MVIIRDFPNYIAHGAFNCR